MLAPLTGAFLHQGPAMDLAPASGLMPSASRRFSLLSGFRSTHPTGDRDKHRPADGPGEFPCHTRGRHCLTAATAAECRGTPLFTPASGSGQEHREQRTGDAARRIARRHHRAGACGLRAPSSRNRAPPEDPPDHPAGSVSSCVRSRFGTKSGAPALIRVAPASAGRAPERNDMARNTEVVEDDAGRATVYQRHPNGGGLLGPIVH
jgi:hypothetical protein